MKCLTNFVSLGLDDAKAKALVVERVQAASDHALSRRILARLTGARGPLHAIFGAGLDLRLLESYDRCWPVPDDRVFHYPGATAERPHRRMARFVADYLRSTDRAVVVCEDWPRRRADPPPPGARARRLARLGEDEFYYLLTPGDADLEAIEDVVRPGWRWQTGVCSTSRRIPAAGELDEAFLDEVAREARHVFVPAFDLSGHLIWSLSG